METPRPHPKIWGVAVPKPPRIDAYGISDVMFTFIVGYVSSSLDKALQCARACMYVFVCVCACVCRCRCVFVYVCICTWSRPNPRSPSARYNGHIGPAATVASALITHVTAGLSVVDHSNICGRGQSVVSLLSVEVHSSLAVTAAAGRRVRKTPVNRRRLY